MEEAESGSTQVGAGEDTGGHEGDYVAGDHGGDDGAFADSVDSAGHRP